jgi:hypothetical protein
VWQNKIIVSAVVSNERNEKNERNENNEAKSYSIIPSVQSSKCSFNVVGHNIGRIEFCDKPDNLFS